ncbi:MAG: MarR family winged helix-turn-helix transcriptional regulator [Trueperaceae bacterium]
MPQPPDVTPASDATERDTIVRELALHAMAALRALQHLAQRAFEPLGLSPSQVVVLLMIQRGVDQPKALAEQLETVQSAVSAVLRELQRRGLVARAVDASDRRRVHLQVTGAGLATLERAGDVWLATAAERLAGVPLEDLRATSHVVDLITRTGQP